MIFHQKILNTIGKLQKFTNRFWYPPLIGLLAALDNLILVIPNDGILVSSSMLIPKRWFRLALCVSVGSTLGALILSTLVRFNGHSWVMSMYPGISASNSWLWSQNFFDQYGLLLVFLVAVSPFIQQPVVILAGLSNTSLWQLSLVMFLGRLIKFLLMAYIGSHAPHILSRLWGIRNEVKDVISSNQKDAL